MAEVSTNWSTLKQDMIDDVSDFIHDFKDKALKDIGNKLAEKGISKEKTKIIGGKVVFITDDQQQYSEGQVYFDEVYREVSDESWPESL